MKQDPTLLGPANQLDPIGLGLAEEPGSTTPPNPIVFFD